MKALICFLSRAASLLAADHAVLEKGAAEEKRAEEKRARDEQARREAEKKAVTLSFPEAFATARSFLAESATKP